MKITILTLFPEMFEGFLTTSIIKRAIGKEIVKVEVLNIRDYTENKYGRVDTPPIGGGAGLVMQAQPVVKALESIEPGRKILFSPRGTTFNQRKAFELARETHLILVCGHYEGIDERVNKYVDELMSIGDFILTGGELASMVVSDAVIRLLDGVISIDSLNEESFTHNSLLEYPQYTEPFDFRGDTVPLVLYSGNHKAIEKWRRKQSLYLTYTLRPDLYKLVLKSKGDDKLLNEALEGTTGQWELDAIEKSKKFTTKK
jgi:tRNA (guanine37-N1)-methyltransferase